MKKREDFKREVCCVGNSPISSPLHNATRTVCLTLVPGNINTLVFPLPKPSFFSPRDWAGPSGRKQEREGSLYHPLVQFVMGSMSPTAENSFTCWAVCPSQCPRTHLLHTAKPHLGVSSLTKIYHHHQLGEKNCTPTTRK